jgi:hypothetical protein
MGNRSYMILTLYKKTEAINTPELAWDAQGNAIEFGDSFPVMLWKFIDENGNLWNTETAIDGTEEEAASIILGSMQ